MTNNVTGYYGANAVQASALLSNPGHIPAWKLALKDKWEAKIKYYGNENEQLSEAIEHIPQDKREAVASLFLDLVDKNMDYHVKVRILEKVQKPNYNVSEIAKFVRIAKREILCIGQAQKLLDTAQAVHEAIHELPEAKQNAILDAALPWIQETQFLKVNEEKQLLDIIKLLSKIPEGQLKDVVAFVKLAGGAHFVLETLQCVSNLPDATRIRAIHVAQKHFVRGSYTNHDKIKSILSPLVNAVYLEKIECGLERIAPLLEGNRWNDQISTKQTLLEMIAEVDAKEWISLVERAKAWKELYSEGNYNLLHVCLILIVVGKDISDDQFIQAVKFIEVEFCSEREERLLILSSIAPEHRFRCLEAVVSLYAEEISYRQLQFLKIMSIVSTFDFPFKRQKEIARACTALMDDPKIAIYEIADQELMVDAFKVLIIHEKKYAAPVTSNSPPKPSIVEELKSLSIEYQDTVLKIVDFYIAYTQLEWVLSNFGASSPFLECPPARKSIPYTSAREWITTQLYMHKLFKDIMSKSAWGKLTPEQQKRIVKGQCINALLSMREGPAFNIALNAVTELVKNDAAWKIYEATIPKESADAQKSYKCITNCQLALLQAALQKEEEDEIARLEADAKKCYQEHDQIKLKEVREQIKAARLRLKATQQRLRIEEFRIVCQTAFPGNIEAIPLMRLLALLTVTNRINNPAKEKIIRELCDIVPRENKKGKKSLEPLRDYKGRIKKHEKETEERISDKMYYLLFILQSKEEARLMEAPITPVMNFVCHKTLGVEIPAQQISTRFRNPILPNAFFTYATTLRTLKEDVIVSYFESAAKEEDQRFMLSLGQFASAVCDGTFRKQRYDAESSIHLATIQANKIEKVKLEKWKGFALQGPTNVTLIPVLEVEPFNFEEWYENEEKSGHMYVRINSSPHLLDWLKLYKPEQAKKLKSNFKNWIQATEREDQIRCLIELQTIVETAPPCQFKRNLAGKIKELQEIPTVASAPKDVTIEITDDPLELMLCGSWARGSCQTLDGFAEHNKGLFGYLWGGHNLLILIKDKEGNHLARALLKLPINEKGKCTLHLEPTYFGKLCPMEYKNACNQAVVDAACHAADAINTHLTSDKSFYPKQVHSVNVRPMRLSFLGCSNAPYEYSDSTRGIQSDCRYYLTNGTCQTTLAFLRDPAMVREEEPTAPR